jgi:hypothetical protein
VSLSLSRLFFVTILGSAKMFHLICVQENGFHWFFGSGLVRERERERGEYFSFLTTQNSLKKNKISVTQPHKNP